MLKKKFMTVIMLIMSLLMAVASVACSNEPQTDGCDGKINSGATVGGGNNNSGGK